MAAPPASPTDAPRRLGRYLLARELWSAAWFSVWSAIDTEMASSPAAVKLIHASLLDSDVTRLRLLDAARAGAKLAHPNVLETREVLHVDGQIGLGTAEVDGVPLREVLRAAASHGVSVPPPVALRIALELLAALETAHSASGDEAWPDPITPVDLTPENVLLTSAGAIKVVDVTLERAAAGLVSPLAAELVGYRAPERLDRAGDQRSDLFAVGVLLWEMLADKPLFSGGNVAEAVRKRTIPRLDDAATRPGGALPAKLASAIARALTRATAGRFPSADHMGQALMSSGVAIASPDDVATLVALVQRARAVSGSSLRGPTTQVLRQEFLQTPLVGTVVSPLAKPQPAPTPQGTKGAPVGKVQLRAKAAPAAPAEPPSEAARGPTESTIASEVPTATIPEAAVRPPPPPARAPLASAGASKERPAPPPRPATVAARAVTPAAPPVPSPPALVESPAVVPVDVATNRTPTPIVPTPMLVAPPHEAAPAGPFFFPVDAAAAVSVVSPASVAEPPVARFDEPTTPYPPQSLPPARSKPWWRRPPAIIGGIALAGLLWIVVLTSSKRTPESRVDAPKARPTVSVAAPPSPPSLPPRPREEPPPTPTVAAPVLPALDPPPPAAPTGGDAPPGGTIGAREAGSVDTPAAPPPPPPEPTKPPPPRRKYNPKTI